MKRGRGEFTTWWANVVRIKDKRMAQAFRETSEKMNIDVQTLFSAFMQVIGQEEVVKILSDIAGDAELLAILKEEVADNE
jgi:mannitol/fructose-specific phosphotransferase system IIA component (Ntr-type)